jgi:Flp pilus assembly protein TadG
MSLEDDVRYLIDRQAVVDVLHTYCELVDAQDHDAMVEKVFAADGSDDHGEGPVAGRAAIAEWFREATANIASNAHNVSNVIVEIDGDKARMRSRVTSWTWTMGSLEGGTQRPADYVVSVSYHDELTRYPEGWRIDRRVLVPHGSVTGHPTVLGLGVLPQTQAGIQALSRR